MDGTLPRTGIRPMNARTVDRAIAERAEIWRHDPGPLARECFLEKTVPACVAALRLDVVGKIFWRDDASDLTIAALLDESGDFV
jgi:hypothetical protein